MPKQKKQQRYQVGMFYLKEPDHRYVSYRICWANKVTRQTDGISTGTADFELAKSKIHEHALKAGKEELLKDEPVLSSMVRYDLKVMAKRPSHNNHSLAMESIQRILGSPMISEMTPSKQLEFVEGCRKEGIADTTIIRRLGCVWASMNYAQEFQHVSEGVVPERISTKRWDAQGGKTKRLLSLEEVGQILNTACSVFRSMAKPLLIRPNASEQRATYAIRWFNDDKIRHYQSLGTKDAVEAQARYEEFSLDLRSRYPDTWTIDYNRVDWRLMIAALGSGARRQATVDLQADQILHVVPGHDVLDLNPQGRIQTSKFRPKIPIAPTFGKWLAAFAANRFDAALDSDLGRKLICPNRADAVATFARLSAESGVDFSSHMLRHFVATRLAHSPRISSPWERDMFMGWRRAEGSAMGSVYNHYDPNYLRGAAQAIEDLFEALSKYTFADLLLRGFQDQPQPDEAWAPELPAAPMQNAILLFPAKAPAATPDSRLA